MCKYCEDKVDDRIDLIVVDIDGRIDSVYIDGNNNLMCECDERPINYCPMCGRDLITVQSAKEKLEKELREVEG